MQHLLGENERQMAEMAEGWEQRMEEARRQWQQELSLTARDGADTRWQQSPYLQNVNEDPQLSGIIKMSLGEG